MSFPLPINFGGLAAGVQNLSLYDTQFSSVQTPTTFTSGPGAPGGTVVMTSSSTFFTARSVAVGSVGTFLVFGNVSANDSAGSAQYVGKLSDGTTTIASGVATSAATSSFVCLSFIGIITNPAGTLVIQASSTTTTSTIRTDLSIISAIRIG